MPDLHRFLSRRWLLAGLSGGALLVGLAMVHPYPRQSLFGPTIRGKPRCVWEAELRRYVRDDANDGGLSAWLLRLIPVQPDRLSPRELFDHPDMTPVVVEFLDDPDPEVRTKILSAIGRYPSLHNESALPALRRRMEDTVADNRIRAAITVWKIAKDKEAIAVLHREVNDERNAEDDRKEALVFFFWSEIRDDAPDVLIELAKLSGDRCQPIRRSVMETSLTHGIGAVPVLKQGLADPDLQVRRQAAIGLGRLGVNEKGVASILITMLAECQSAEEITDAAQALSGLGPNAAAIQPLNKLAVHSDRKVRDAVSTALAKVTAPPSIEKDK